MRSALLALVGILVLANSALAQARVPPADFVPLTSLPWNRGGATLDSVLKAIFLEPYRDIRYPVLAAYLRTMPVEDLGAAFEKCIDLEGVQSPNDLVTFFLNIWAERDPRACWKRTQELFKVVAIEEGWMAYDSWLQKPPITAQDIDALRASRFYLAPTALKSFPHGVEQSTLPANERVALMKAFTDRWFAAFGTWPGYWREEPVYADEASELLSYFERPPVPNMQVLSQLSGVEGNACFEVAMRRWLESDPTAAVQIMEKVKEHSDAQPEEIPALPPYGLYLLWAKADLPTLIRWAAPLRPFEDSRAAHVKGFLMPHVDQATRTRWIEQARGPEGEDSSANGLIHEWAKWDPKGALLVAASADPETFGAAACAAVAGPFGSEPFDLENTNGMGSGFTVLKNLDWSRLSDGFRSSAFAEGYAGMEIMERWGDIDIGGAAQFGFAFLIEAEYVAPEDFIDFLSGEDLFASGGNMIDRTFCALRTWAVFKPAEMEKWIATIKDPGIQKALHALLRDPWGPG
jgi:hypothetical protein